MKDYLKHLKAMISDLGQNDNIFRKGNLTPMDEDGMWQRWRDKCNITET